MPPSTTINGETYLKILQEKLLSFIDIRQCKFLLHDGAPCHRHRAVRNCMEDMGVQVIGPWPGNSPDLNPIENCWAILKRKVAEKKPISIAALKETITQVWAQEITPNYCRSLFFPRLGEENKQNNEYLSFCLLINIIM